jgi:hypothetical protein
MDNNTTIHQLLERYFAGETTLQEEDQIKAYFQRNDIDPDLKQYQPLFSFFITEAKQQTSSQFEQKLQQFPKANRLVVKRSAYRWAIAATIAMLLTLGVYWLNQQSVSPPQTAAIDWSKYEPQTEEEALLITKKALTRTTQVIQQSMATAKGEIDNIQQILQPFK